jgi:hypothetical protein
MNKYDVGDKVRLSITVRDYAAALADPTLTCTARKPDGTTTSLTPVQSSTGNWYADVTVDQSGHWFYRWTATGAVVAAEEGQFYVRERKV